MTDHAELIDRLRGAALFQGNPIERAALLLATSNVLAALVAERDAQADKLTEIADVVSQARREADRMSPETALYVFSRIDGIAQGGEKP
jgi:hypothetical protein